MEIIMKPTEACNGTCVYCSADGRLDKHRMLPKKRLAPLFESFLDWLRRDRRRQLRFIWHGGEPMLCGPDYYMEVVERQRQVFGDDLLRVKNAMQSNLSLVDEQWIPCLRELLKDQVIGTSFDIVDGVRGLAGGKDLNGIWINAVHLLRRNGIRVGVVYVAHRKSLGRARDLYYYFRNLDPRLHLRVNPLYREGRAGEADSQTLWITADEYGQFLVDLSEVWLADGVRFTIMPLAEWKRAWHGHFRLCCDSRGICHLSHLGINPDGTVFGCGRASDHGAGRLGSIFEDDLEEMLQKRAASELAARSPRLHQTYCKDCRYWQLCHGGCPMMGLLYYGDPMRETYFCGARKRLFEHFESLFGPPAESGQRSAFSSQQEKAPACSGPASGAERSLQRTVLLPPLPRGGRGGHRPRRQSQPPAPGAPSLAQQGPGDHASLNPETRTLNPFIVTIERPEGWPMAYMVRIITQRANLPELGAARIDARDRIRLFVGETSFVESPGRYQPFAGQITILAADSSESNPDSVIPAMKQCGCEYLLRAIAAHPVSKAKEATSRGVPARLECSERWSDANLLELLDYFLHNAELQVPVQPFYFLAAAIGGRSRTTLWHLFDSVPGRNCFVDSRQRVSLSRPWADRGLFFGTTGDDPESFRESPLSRDLQEFPRRVFIGRTPCAFCEHYRYCAGFWRAAFEGEAACIAWRQVMDRMVAEYRRWARTPGSAAPASFPARLVRHDQA